METKHTKNVWAAKGNEIIAGRTLIAELYNDIDFSKNPGRIEIDRIPTKEEAKANAKLIAAAPELLEALKIAQQYVNVFMIRGEEPLLGENLKTDSFKILEALQKATEY